MFCSEKNKPCWYKNQIIWKKFFIIISSKTAKLKKKGNFKFILWVIILLNGNYHFFK